MKAPSYHNHPTQIGKLLPLFALLVLLLVVAVAWLRMDGASNQTAADTIDPNLATAIRIQPIGSVAVREANRELQAASAVYQMQCAACHTAGVAGAPIFGVASDWAPRLGMGLEALVISTLQGKGAMGAQSGGAFSDLEIARAVVYLANASGASFEEPTAPDTAAQ